MLLTSALLLVAVILALVAWRWRARPPCLRRRVIVNLVGEPFALRGLLWKQSGPWSILRQAEVLQTGQPSQPLDGEAVVERRRVSFIQILPAP